MIANNKKIIHNKKRRLAKLWYFIWEDNSIWSWIVNTILAFILIKYIIYPGLGFVLQTSHPVVAVVSESMEHDNGFESWWKESKKWYVANSISQEDFDNFPLKNGFNKGDIMVLKGKKPKDLEIGEVIVFWSAKKDPIIHRIVKKWKQEEGYHFETKGDNYKTNPAPIRSTFLNEVDVKEEQIVGSAILRIPLLGYVKVGFVELINIIKLFFS